MPSDRSACSSCSSGMDNAEQPNKIGAGEWGRTVAGRKQSPLKGETQVIQLASRLRELRASSGLTLRQLAAKTGYSTSTLSNAEAGRRAPTWEVLQAYVQGCGANPVPWLTAWREVHDASPQVTEEDAPPSADERVPSSADQEPAPARRHTPRHLRAAVGLVVVAAVAAVGALTLYATLHTAEPTRADSPRVADAKDDTDPYQDGCKADHSQIDWQPVKRADGRSFGTLILMYSPACRAAWGYLNAPNSHRWTTYIVARRLTDGASAPSFFSGDAALGSWGNVLSTRPGCVLVEAWVHDESGDGPHARTACFSPGAAAR